ncbi:MAG: sulfite oxidase heme-binding subunit YedZ [Pyrinomonadaceae bacterium]
MNDTQFKKVVVSVNALVPLAMIAVDAARGRLGANPVEFVLRTTGVLTLVALFATLAITPLRKTLGWNDLIKVRRMLGLYTFFYVCLHLITYLVFDRGLDLWGTITDVARRPFIAIGMAAFLAMVPLAATSTSGMIKRLGGKRWQMLHRLIYPIAVAGVVHFWMIVKSDVLYPAIFALVLSVLLGYRLLPKIKTAAVKTAVSKGSSSSP